jgi:16S rRNA (cytosine967-C5)-methyltransferase
MNLRKSAAQILLRVIRDGQSLTAALDSVLPQMSEQQDRAFVQALCFGVCRTYHRLNFILEQLLSKPLRNKDQDIRILMLLGLYQLIYMRVKPHAAVSETVAAAGRKSWAKSLINAVLRHYQRDQETLQARVEQADTAIRDSHPDWMVTLLEQQWPEQAAAILSANNQSAPMVLRVNLQQGDREAYLQILAEADIQGVAHEHCDSAIVLDRAVPVESLPGFASGTVSVQDTAAQLAAQLLDVHAGHAVLDLCAAPGGKTAAILERHPELESLLALDVDAERLKRVQENLSRLQLRADILAADATDPTLWTQQRLFDRILLDAPCSALGVIRRHPDIKLLRRLDDIAALVKVQATILDTAWSLLKPGGKLLYATCSVLKMENEAQIAAFLQHHQDAVENKIFADWGISRPYGRQILTGEEGMDGFYYAVLQKPN